MPFGQPDFFPIGNFPRDGTTTVYDEALLVSSWGAYAEETFSFRGILKSLALRIWNVGDISEIGFIWELDDNMIHGVNGSIAGRAGMGTFPLYFDVTHFSPIDGVLMCRLRYGYTVNDHITLQFGGDESVQQCYCACHLDYCPIISIGGGG
jgi:hypothetical protein